MVRKSEEEGYREAKRTFSTPSGHQDTLPNIEKSIDQGIWKKKNFIVVFVVFLCVCIGGLGFWTFFFNSPTDSKTTRTFSGTDASNIQSKIKATSGSKVLSSFVSGSSSPVSRVQGWVSQNRVLFIGCSSAIIVLIVSLVVCLVMLSKVTESAPSDLEAVVVATGDKRNASEQVSWGAIIGALAGIVALAVVIGVAVYRSKVAPEKPLTVSIECVYLLNKLEFFEMVYSYDGFQTEQRQLVMRTGSTMMPYSNVDPDLLRENDWKPNSVTISGIPLLQLDFFKAIIPYTPGRDLEFYFVNSPDQHNCVRRYNIRKRGDGNVNYISASDLSNHLGPIPSVQ
jgi:hypothetical protein